MITVDFKKTIIALRGEAGKKWLEDLPRIIKEYESRWQIEVFKPFTLSYNYVTPAKNKNGENVVLKITFPNNSEFPKEVRALDVFEGNGAIKVLKEDLDKGVVLLEKAEPGTRLREMREEEQVYIASGVIKELHRKISGDLINFFPLISDWGKVFDRYKKKFSLNSGRVPKWMFDKGQTVFKSSRQNEKFLLHGDLHTDNILSSGRGWLVIDPKGVVGEREFELGAFLRNPIYDYPKGTNYKNKTKEKIIQFSQELGFDKKRILEWTFACAVISILWFLEDQGEIKKIYLQNAELIDQIRV